MLSITQFGLCKLNVRSKDFCDLNGCKVASVPIDRTWSMAGAHVDEVHITLLPVIARLPTDALSYADRKSIRPLLRLCGSKSRSSNAKAYGVAVYPRRTAPTPLTRLNSLVDQTNEKHPLRPAAYMGYAHRSPCTQYKSCGSD
jgi:hypothetical protein